MNRTNDPAIQFSLVDPASEPATEALTNYFNELTAIFGETFDIDTTRASAVDDLRPPTGAFTVALASDGTVLGCGGVRAFDAETAEVKRMWIAPHARGIGLGRALLSQLEAAARSLGYGKIVLDTHASLTPAINLYERAGYQAIPAYNENEYAQVWYAKTLD